MDEYIFNSLKFAYADSAYAAQQSFRFRSLLARRRAGEMELLSMRVLIGVPKSQLTTIFSAKYQLTTIFLINSQLTTNSG